jgi:hypothetical protein
MNFRSIRLTLGLILAAVPMFLAGCSSNSSGSGLGNTPQSGNLAMIVSDASTEDWANIGIKILSISLVPQGGGSPVNVYTAPTPAPTLNLAQLDQLGELLENVSVPAGTYTGAILTISGNPADVLLTASSDPENGFIGTAGATIPLADIDVQGTTGNAGSQTVSVTVTFKTPVVVTANQTSALDLEFDLSHPGFLVGHVPPAAGTTIWAMDFDGPVRHHPIPDLTRFLLRDIYGTVTSVNSDGSLTITRDFPAEPPAATPTSETAISTTHTIQIFPDSTNGTLFYDVDNAAQNQTVKSFSTVSGDLPVGEFVRVAARYQTGGTLVAVRTWASSTFGNIYVSPEGHVLHVNTTTNVIDVDNEIGRPVHLTVTNNTVFYSGTTQISTTGAGIAFLANLERGFKIHASVVNPLAVPLVADTINIEIARFDGKISIPNGSVTNFTYTRNFNTSRDNYIVPLPYISPATANGKDPISGNPITGFKWWNFTFPTIVDSDAGGGTDATAINDFIMATGGTMVSFGGTAPPVTATGASYAVWGDPANLTGWAAPWTVLVPTPLPFGTAATSYHNGTPSGSFMLSVPGGINTPLVDLSTTPGSGTLVYQVDRSGFTVKIISIDITTTAGQNTLPGLLVASTPVKVFGVPQPDGSIKAYVVTFFTGTMPMAVF